VIFAGCGERRSADNLTWLNAHRGEQHESIRGRVATHLGGGLVTEVFPAYPTGFGAGSRLAGYRLEAQVGVGGMAVVFRARDERLDRLVALKILSPTLALDPSFRRRFIAESRAAAKVDDPHIIPVYEADEVDGVLFIAMRFVRGGDLRLVLEREGSLPAERAAEFISPVASALDAAHRAGLVHRDVKPANILVDAREDRPDHVYLSDFGIAKAAVSSLSPTGPGYVVGTPDYSAPEQIEGRSVDGRTDQYALACVTYRLLAGTVPYERDQITALAYAHVHEPPPSLGARRPDLPGAVDQVLAKAMAKTLGDRYESCGDFADALREALGLTPYRLRRSATVIGHPHPPAPSPSGIFLLETTEDEVLAASSNSADTVTIHPPGGARGDIVQSPAAIVATAPDRSSRGPNGDAVAVPRTATKATADFPFASVANGEQAESAPDEPLSPTAASANARPTLVHTAAISEPARLSAVSDMAVRGGPDEVITAYGAIGPRTRIIRPRHLLGIVAVGFVVGPIFSSWAVGLAAMILTALVVAVRRSHMRSDPSAIAQARTRRRLSRMRRRGYESMHACSIPGTGEVIDHLVVGPTGIYALSSQLWDPQFSARVRSADGAIYHGPANLTPSLERTHQHAARVAELISAESGRETHVQPGLVVYGAKLFRDGARLWGVARLGDVDVFAPWQTSTWLKHGPAVFSAAQVQHLAATAARMLPACTPGKTPLMSYPSKSS
jgi:serine/threonine protein kinase